MGVGTQTVGADQSVRNKILDAARKLFAEEGYRKASMRRIASKIGYSPTTIYNYFKSKSELFFSLTEEICLEHLKRFSLIAESDFSPRDRLHKTMLAYVDMGLESPNSYRVEFMLEHEDWPSSMDHFPEGSNAKKLYDMLHDMVRKCIYSTRQRRVSETEVEFAVQSVWAAAHGITSLLITYPSFPWREAETLKKQVIGSAVDGIMNSVESSLGV